MKKFKLVYTAIEKHEGEVFVEAVNFHDAIHKGRDEEPEEIPVIDNFLDWTLISVEEVKENDSK